MVRTSLCTHSARRNTCGIADRTASDVIVTVADIAEESALTLAVRTPVRIVNLHFHGLGLEFTPIGGMGAIDSTIFIARSVAFVAMLEGRTIAEIAGNLLFGLV